MYKGLNFVLVLLASFVLISCEKKNDNVIDPSYDSPVIVSVTKSTDTVSTTSSAPNISFDLTVVANENNGSPIASVNCVLVDPLGASLGSFALNYIQDVTGGKQYSKNVSASSISCLLVGNYTVQVVAKNDAGLFSSQVNLPLYVRNSANVAPVVINTNLPDSVVRPVSGSIPLTISINVTDADGSCDIKDVYFGAYRPNGNFIGFNPLIFSSNNEWTFTNVVTPSTADSSYGYFKYQFFAKDRSDAVSTGVWDSIKFVRP
ncbi:MAG: hypothetical protein WC139_05560 [Candidatus Kapaibacterium sp.]